LTTTVRQEEMKIALRDFGERVGLVIEDMGGDQPSEEEDSNDQ